MLTGCASGGPEPVVAANSDSNDKLPPSPHEYSEAQCHAEGLTWVGGDLSCLNGTEYAVWSSSACSHLDYYACQAQGFKVASEADEEPDRQDPNPVLAEDEPLWVCEYVPTMDYDWHNDVFCSNGRESLRPYLRESDSYVTEDEIIAAAQEYEASLNSR